MTTAARSLWPDDIRTDDVRTPTEILQEQAQLLEQQTNGILVAKVVEHEAEDRRVIAFDVTAPRIPTTVRLFEAQQSLKHDYPIRFIPPDQDVPEYLRKRVYRSGINVLTGLEGRWEEREWVATSPHEFMFALGKLLSSSAVKSVMFSLIARSRRGEPETDTQDK